MYVLSSDDAPFAKGLQIDAGVGNFQQKVGGQMAYFLRPKSGQWDSIISNDNPTQVKEFRQFKLDTSLDYSNCDGVPEDLGHVFFHSPRLMGELRSLEGTQGGILPCHRKTFRARRIRLQSVLSSDLFNSNREKHKRPQKCGYGGASREDGN